MNELSIIRVSISLHLEENENSFRKPKAGESKKSKHFHDCVASN